VLSQVVIAGAFELPHGLAEGVEVKRVDGAVEGLLDLEFDFIGLDRFVAYSTELPGPAAAPHSFRGIVRQSSLCDALARNGAQFCFELGQRHLGCRVVRYLVRPERPSLRSGARH